MHLVRNLTALAPRFAVWLALAALAIPSASGAAEQHGIAVGTSLKYARGFAHFDYANPKAPKGGRIVLSAPGSFDKLNPFSLKGREAPLLGGLLFEPLTEGALDEPIAAYGLLAQSLDVAEDRLSITYKLNPHARWAGGKPVTAEDVVFSFEVLRSDAATPFYRYYYEDVTKVEALDKLTVRLRFAKKNPELALITGQLPILPKHFYGGKSFADDFNTSALGSGPFLLHDLQDGVLDQVLIDGGFEIHGGELQDLHGHDHLGRQDHALFKALIQTEFHSHVRKSSPLGSWGITFAV